MAPLRSWLIVGLGCCLVFALWGVGTVSGVSSSGSVEHPHATIGTENTVVPTHRSSTTETTATVVQTSADNTSSVAADGATVKPGETVTTEIAAQNTVTTTMGPPDSWAVVDHKEDAVSQTVGGDPDWVWFNFQNVSTPVTHRSPESDSPGTDEVGRQATGKSRLGTVTPTVTMRSDSNATANFIVSDLSAKKIVVDNGDTTALLATIANTGNQQGTQTVTFEVEGFQDSETVTIAGGEQTQVTFTIDTTEIESGNWEFVVSTDDDSVAGTLSVQGSAPAEFSLRDLSPSSTTVEQGEEVSVSMTVENTGGKNATKPLTLSVGEQTGSQDVRLTAGSSERRTFVINTGSLSPDEYTITATTDDDSVSGTLTVRPPPDPAQFSITNFSPERGTVQQGKSYTVSATIENVGDTEGTQTIEFAVGESRNTQEITLASGEQTTVDFTAESDGLSGEQMLSVSTANDSAEGTLTVDVPQPAQFQVTTVNQSHQSVEMSDTVQVLAMIENTGDQDGTETVTLEVGELEKDRPVRLAGGERTQVQFSIDTAELSDGEWTYTVSTADDSGSETFTIRPTEETPDEESTPTATETPGTDGPTEPEPTPEDEVTPTTEDNESSGLMQMLFIGGGGIAVVFGAYALSRRSGDESAAGGGTGSSPGRGNESNAAEHDGTGTQGTAADTAPSDTGSGVGSTATDSTDSESARRDSTGGTDPIPSLAYDEINKGKLIGSGGNADVYHATARTGAEQLELALKEPRVSGTLHTEAVDRLLNEAEIWQSLDDHEHIVDVVEYGSQPLPWIAMEYMDAGHLGERTGRLPVDQGLWTAVAVTKALRHAHDRGVAHLDLKPSNILFESVEDGWDTPKVADWGLSKHLLEHSKSIEGMSPHYAAPEQFDAEAYGSTDHSTDIYQLGAVFYDLFTGRPPFEGKPFEVMNKIQNQEPTPPSEIADVPPALDEILLTAMATEKENRYEHVLYLRDELQSLWEE
jgi:hypothetical protein